MSPPKSFSFSFSFSFLFILYLSLSPRPFLTKDKENENENDFGGDITLSCTPNKSGAQVVLALQRMRGILRRFTLKSQTRPPCP
jgi:hypothetical protein